MEPSAVRVAVVGAGMAGATCARLLADAGHDVQVFDKSRGVGGRMATRRVTWSADDGVLHQAAFDHGAPGFIAHTADFVHFAEQAHRDGLLARWSPAMAPGSGAPLGSPAMWVPTPDLPALCRALLAGLPVHTACTVDALQHGPGGWRLARAGATVAEGFSAVLLAIPPLQAATLLRPHRDEWAQRAQALPMLPGWTLMGVSDDVNPDPDSDPAWNLAWPTSGPLSWVVRNDAKPGRQRAPGLAHWVVHATAAWSQTHLESPAADVQAALQVALAQWLGRPLTWHHATAHRWRLASVPRAAATPGGCWWDATLQLGVCGDALGGAGVEGAWLSARALATAVIGSNRPAPDSSGLNLPNTD